MVRMSNANKAKRRCSKTSESTGVAKSNADPP